MLLGNDRVVKQVGKLAAAFVLILTLSKMLVTSSNPIYPFD